MFRIKTLTVGVAVSAALGFGANAVAAISAGAVAQSYLDVKHFQIRQANVLGAGISNQSILPTVTVLSANSTAQVNPFLDGVSNPGTVIAPLGGNINLFKSVGAGYNPTALLTGGGLPASSYAGGTSTSVGNALVTSDDVVVNSSVELKFPSVIGSSQSKQTLDSRFSFNTVAPFVFELSFDSTGFMRTALGPNFLLAKAARTWNATVNRLKNVNGITFNETVLSLSPDGVAGNVVCTNNGLNVCSEVQDGFSLNTNNPTALPTEDFNSGVQFGLFQFELGLAKGTYTFDITHTTTADALIVAVPEPTSIALIGLGMLGIGAASRRRKA